MAGKGYTRILWDFNGTLMDDLALCIDSVNLLLTRRGMPTVDVDSYREAFCFPVENYYARVGLPSEGEDFVQVAHEWVDAYRSGEDTVRVREGVLDLLIKLKEAGIPQGVLSATQANMLKGQVEQLGLTPYFDLLLGREDIYARDKSSIAVAYRNAHPHDQILMIGDTLHDYETARAGGFDCILVEGGHQSRRTLETAGCPVMRSFQEVAEWLELT